MRQVASLGMYDTAGLRDANDALWRALAARLAALGLADVPAGLDRARPLDAVWRDPRLLLAQACGYPLVTRYRETLRYVATPHYAAPGCAGAFHRSRIVVRADDPAQGLADLRGRRAAISEAGSNSGMNLLRAGVAPLARGGRFFAAVIETGSHARSLRAIADGAADVAAIDSVSFAHAARDSPDLVALVRTIGWSDLSPCLPFVTAIATPEATVRLLRRALAEALAGEEASAAREALLLAGVERLPVGAYGRLLGLERAAARLGYPALA